MARKNVAKDAALSDGKQGDGAPSSAKKFRQTPEIQGFYSFIYDNGLHREAYEIIDQILKNRRAARAGKATKAD